MELLEGGVAQGCEELCGVPGVGGDAGAGASFGIGRKEGGIGFDHDAIVGDELGRLGDLFGVFVGDDACEGDHGAEIEHCAGLVWVAGETVEDEARWIEGGCAEDGQKIVEGLSAVDDDGKVDAFGFARFDEGEVGSENRVLDRADWSGVFVIEPELAPGDAFFVLGDFADGVPVVGFFVAV